jgi:MATE family multidrug resistance protein
LARVLTAVRREIPVLFAVALPLAVAQLAQHAMGFVDTLMAGRLGPDALAGIALGSVAFFFVAIVLSSMLFAVGPLVAQATGARRPEEAVRALRQGLLWALLLTLPAMAALWAMPALLRVLGQDPVVVELASSYLRTVAWSMGPFLVFTALRAYLEGQGHTRPLMYVAFVGVGLNVVANQAFMFGRWGFPALGIAGTGVATSLVYAAMAALALAYVGWRYRWPSALGGRWRWDGATAREVLRLGWPISVTVGFETGLFAVSAVLMGRIGSAELAGHQIAIQTASLTFMIPLALGVATSARVGHAVGRGDPLGARAAGAVGIGLALLTMVASAALFLFAPRAIVGLYLDLGDPANAVVVGHAVAFLGVAAAFQLFDGLQVSAIGALRGLKDTRAPMLITLVSYWLVGIGGGVGLAFGLGLGGVGLWWGLVLGLGVAGAALLARFLALLRRWRPAPVALVDSRP